MKLYDVHAAKESTDSSWSGELKFIPTLKCEFCSQIFKPTPEEVADAALTHEELEILETGLPDIECPECDCTTAGD